MPKKPKNSCRGPIWASSAAPKTTVKARDIGGNSSAGAATAHSRQTHQDAHSDAGVFACNAVFAPVSPLGKRGESRYFRARHAYEGVATREGARTWQYSVRGRCRHAGPCGCRDARSLDLNPIVGYLPMALR